MTSLKWRRVVHFWNEKNDSFGKKIVETDFNWIHLNNEQNTLRISPYLPVEWRTIAEDFKYEVKLTDDGRLYLVDNNPKRK